MHDSAKAENQNLESGKVDLTNSKFRGEEEQSSGSAKSIHQAEGYRGIAQNDVDLAIQRKVGESKSGENSSNLSSTDGGVIQLSRMDATDATFDPPTDSPYQAIQNRLPGLDIHLAPGQNFQNTNNPSNAQNQYQRPREVVATIEGARRGSAGRAANASGITSSVGNLGNQEMILRNGDRSQTYQGGHLIGDNLLAAGVNSMVDWNLAPQQKDFNHPVYFGMAEELIEKGAKNPVTNAYDKNIPIEVKVNLSYQAQNFAITIDQLVRNSVISTAQLNGFNQQRPGQPQAQPQPQPQPQPRVNLTDTISFTERIPTAWNISAEIAQNGLNNNQAQPGPNQQATFGRHILTVDQQNARTNQNPVLGPGQFGVYSPDITRLRRNPTQAPNANPPTYDYLIGGGPQLRLQGWQGHPTAPVNAQQGNQPLIAPPVQAIPSLWGNTTFDINKELNEKDGEIDDADAMVLEGLAANSKTNISKLRSAMKRKFANKQQGITSPQAYRPVFSSFEDFRDFVLSKLPSDKSPSGRAIREAIKLQRGSFIFTTGGWNTGATGLLRGNRRGQGNQPARRGRGIGRFRAAGRRRGRNRRGRV